MRSCQNCGTGIDHKRNNAKYCSSACKVEAYRARKGIQKPAFLSNAPNRQNQNFRLQTPTEEGRKFFDIYGQVTAKERELLEERQELIQEKERISNRYARQLALTTAGGAGLGYAVSDKEDTGNILASMGIGALTGHLIGRQVISQMTENERQQVEKIQNRLSHIEYELHQNQQQRTAINVDKKLINQQFKGTKTKDIKTVTAKELDKMEFDRIIIEGDYSNLLGAVEPNFYMVAHGAKGSGKSTFAVRLAKDLVKSGRVGYFAFEEGIKSTLQNKTRLVGLNSPHVDFISSNNWQELKEKAKGYEFAIIDSISAIPEATPEEMRELRSNAKGAIIALLQATKAGTHKGSNQFAHDADIVLKLENGNIETEKNRFGGIEQTAKVFEGLPNSKVVSMGG